MRKGSHLTIEHRAKLRAINLGHRHSEKTKAKISASSSHHPMSMELKAKLRAIHLGRHPSKASLAKNRVAHLGKANPHIGVLRSPETRAKMSVARKGRPVSPETRIKMSTAHMGRHPNEITRAKLSSANIGHHHSMETRAKMSASIKKAYTKTGVLEKISGSNSHFWRGGSGSEPYVLGWSTIRREIRKRDLAICQHPNCYIPENGRKHPVHHIDYDKKNSNQANLILLCSKHHDQTKRGDKEHWTSYYRSIQEIRGNKF